jgi:hypothetical protein
MAHSRPESALDYTKINTLLGTIAPFIYEIAYTDQACHTALGMVRLGERWFHQRIGGSFGDLGRNFIMRRIAQ